MPGTYSDILLHIVFSTKDREALISDEIQNGLYAYIRGIVDHSGGATLAIGGVADHVHLLVRWRPDATISDLVRVMKARSSRWVHVNHPGVKGFAWQEGYAVFSVHRKNLAGLQSYIARQAEHHLARDYREEMLAALRVHEIDLLLDE